MFTKTVSSSSPLSTWNRFIKRSLQLRASSHMKSSNFTTFHCRNSSLLNSRFYLFQSSHVRPTRSFGKAPDIAAITDTELTPTVSPPQIKLYQYQICPFCNITKSLLSYLDLNHLCVEVNPLTKAELKPWSGGYRKVPIAVINGQQINGSQEIVAHILQSPLVQRTLVDKWEASDQQQEQQLDTITTTTTNNNNIMTIEQFQQSENAQRWFQFATQDLAPLLYPNICGSLRDSYQAFSYVQNVDSFSTLQKMSIRVLGALAMYLAASKVKSKRNITDEKAALREALATFESEGLQNGATNFSSGYSNAPDMGDLAMFGVLHSVHGTNAHKWAVQGGDEILRKWYERMQQMVGNDKIDHVDDAS